MRLRKRMEYVQATHLNLERAPPSRTHRDCQRVWGPSPERCFGCGCGAIKHQTGPCASQLEGRARQVCRPARVRVEGGSSVFRVLGRFRHASGRQAKQRGRHVDIVGFKFALNMAWTCPLMIMSDRPCSTLTRLSRYARWTQPWANFGFSLSFLS